LVADMLKFVGTRNGGGLDERGEMMDDMAVVPLPYDLFVGWACRHGLACGTERGAGRRLGDTRF
jgi:hypothetical protein